MFIDGLIPGKQSESDVLLSDVHHITVNTVLIMTIGTELKGDIFFHGQLIGSHEFPSTGINAFSVNAVSSSECRLPFHISTPSVFIYIACGNRKDAVVFSYDIPFVENRYPVLQCHIGHAVFIVVERKCIFKIINAGQRPHLFPYLPFRCNICVDLSPAGRKDIC